MQLSRDPPGQGTPRLQDGVYPGRGLAGLHRDDAGGGEVAHVVEPFHGIGVVGQEFHLVVARSQLVKLVCTGASRCDLRDDIHRVAAGVGENADGWHSTRFPGADDLSGQRARHLQDGVYIRRGLSRVDGDQAGGGEAALVFVPLVHVPGSKAGEPHLVISGWDGWDLVIPVRPGEVVIDTVIILVVCINPDVRHPVRLGCAGNSSGYLAALLQHGIDRAGGCAGCARHRVGLL